MKKFHNHWCSIGYVCPQISELFENLIFILGLIQRDHKINVYYQSYMCLSLNVIRQNAYRIWSENFKLWINTWAKNSSIICPCNLWTVWPLFLSRKGTWNWKQWRKADMVVGCRLVFPLACRVKEGESCLGLWKS